MHKLSRRSSLRALGLGAGALLAVPRMASAAEKVSVRLKWLPQAQFAGFYVAKAKNFYADSGLDVTINPGGPNINSESLVSAGSDTFGVGGGTDSILFGRVKNLPIAAISMAFQLSPNILVARKSSGIVSPKDFRGKKVGTFFTGGQYTLYALLAKAGIAQSEVTIVPQGTTVTPFVDGELDVITTVSYNTLITLKNRMKEEELALIVPDNFGVVSQYDPIITSEKVIAEKPQVVQSFLGSTLKGWKYAFANKKEAIDIVMAAGASGSLNRPHQEAMLDEVEKLMLGAGGREKGLGLMDKSRIASQQAVLVEFKAIPGPVDLDKAFVSRFWDAVPDTDKKV